MTYAATHNTSNKNINNCGKHFKSKTITITVRRGGGGFKGFIEVFASGG